MSRAFTKEIDDAPEPPVADRPISSARNLVTPAGARQIEQAIADLTPRIEASAGQEAIAASLRRDLRYWEARRASMEIVEPVDAPDAVRFGTTVTIKRSGKAQQLSIVGEDEADPANGAIAWTSPLARALDGAFADEAIEFQAGGRTEEITVVSIR